MLKLRDYQKIIYICNFALSQGHTLNIEQIKDIDDIRDALYKIIENGGQNNAMVRSKKIRKTTRV